MEWYLSCSSHSSLFNFPEHQLVFFDLLLKKKKKRTQWKLDWVCSQFPSPSVLSYLLSFLVLTFWNCRRKKSLIFYNPYAFCFLVIRPSLAFSLKISDEKKKKPSFHPITFRFLLASWVSLWPPDDSLHTGESLDPDWMVLDAVLWRNKKEWGRDICETGETASRAEILQVNHADSLLYIFIGRNNKYVLIVLNFWKKKYKKDNRSLKIINKDRDRR